MSNSGAFETFKAFIPGIVPLLDDDSVSEIQVNSASRVFVERAGIVGLEEVSIDPERLMVGCELLAQRINGSVLSPENPIVDTRLPDGSRVAICVAPVSVDGVTLTIRKHQKRYYSMRALIETGMLDSSLAGKLVAAVVGHDNILVSGATGSGKTTLVNALAHQIPMDERVIIIEDTTEIELPHENQRRFEAQAGQVTVQQILKASLRHSPQRLILGEIRGPEAYDLLELLNTGHSGSISTLHANSALLALRRFSSCVMRAGVDIPYRAIRSDIADSISIVVHLERRAGKRRVVEAMRVAGYDSDTDKYELEEL